MEKSLLKYHTLIIISTSLLGYTPEDLFSEKFYKKLYNDEDIEVHYPNCSSLDSISNKYKSSLKILCAQLVKYLKTPYIPLDRKTLAYDDCILLNYWVYNRLVSIYGTDDSSKILRPLASLTYKWNDIVEKSQDKYRNNRCTPDGSIVTQNDWRERKKLYDYYVNYSTIEKTIPYYVKTCPKYWTYVESHTSVFEYFKARCSEEKYPCPEFYDKCKKYDPKQVLSKFKCHEEMEKKKAEQTLANARSALPANIPAGQEASSGMSTSSEVSAGGSPLTRDGTHPATKTGDILLGVVATSLTSGALYRVNINSLIHIYRIILVKIFLYYMAINNKYVTCILNYCLYKSLHP
ncbi:hypothetical protein PVMG_05989 [Plasmodium vivax Mauritania I]|uniref:Variable surface protein Vir4 n=1 Tax=Plasmodium vivax Mauritania I TaxID=1035515 RepID=A0A0J9T410_PLAVI|nr:hypothetical protein PVMG_05989 [Plasmodium vivax Mauritania I]